MGLGLSEIRGGPEKKHPVWGYTGACGVLPGHPEVLALTALSTPLVFSNWTVGQLCGYTGACGVLPGHPEVLALTSISTPLVFSTWTVGQLCG